MLYAFYSLLFFILLFPIQNEGVESCIQFLFLQLLEFSLNLKPMLTQLAQLAQFARFVQLVQLAHFAQFDSFKVSS